MSAEPGPGGAPYAFDVATADHDRVKTGQTVERWSRVVVSADEWPDWRIAAQVAACLAVAHHGGMPTAVLPRY